MIDKMLREFIDSHDKFADARPSDVQSTIRLHNARGWPIDICLVRVLAVPHSLVEKWITSAEIQSGRPCYYDPIEFTPEFSTVVDEAIRKAESETDSLCGCFGFIKYFWSAQQRILKEDYGIDWATPAEMNPELLID